MGQFFGILLLVYFPVHMMTTIKIALDPRDLSKASPVWGRIIIGAGSLYFGLKFVGAF